MAVTTTSGKTVPAPRTSSRRWRREMVAPYVQLMRLDRPSGLWYFWFPHVFGTLLVATVQRSRIEELLYVNFVLFWGTLLMRGATCTWNDTMDVEYDRQVSRCRTRPIARGAVSVVQAHCFTGVQTLLSLAILAWLPPLCTLYAVPAVAGWWFYPLAKRVTDYPQVVLGFPMAWGVFMGAAAMGADPLGLAPVQNVLSACLYGHALERAALRAAVAQVRLDPAVAALYGANVCWTLLYELVYSHQDAAEDLAAGVRNLVLLYVNPKADRPDRRFGTRPLLHRLAAAQIACLAAAGVWAETGAVYFTVAVAGTAIALSVMVSNVKLHQPASCAWWFRVGNIRWAGGAMVGGLLGEYAARSFLRY